MVQNDCNDDIVTYTMIDKAVECFGSILKGIEKTFFLTFSKKGGKKVLKGRKRLNKG
jgi:hypothetical protein